MRPVLLPVPFMEPDELPEAPLGLEEVVPHPPPLLLLDERSGWFCSPLPQPTKAIPPTAKEAAATREASFTIFLRIGSLARARKGDVPPLPLHTWLDTL